MADDDSDFRYLEAFSDAYGNIEEQLGSSFSDFTSRDGGCYIDNAFLTMQPSTATSSLLRSSSAAAASSSSTTLATSISLPLASSSSRSGAVKRGQQNGKSAASEKQSGSTRTKRKKDGWDDAADELGEDRITRHNHVLMQQQHHAKSGTMSVAIGNVFQDIADIPSSGGGGGSGKVNQVLTAKELKR